MTGLFVKKYHVAVLNDDEKFLSRMISALKSWYQNRIVIEKFTDSQKMFEAVNLNQAKDKPFDMAVLSPDELPEKMILKKTMPDLNVIVCQDEIALRMQASRILI